MKKTTLHLGLDVYKESITLALAEGRRNGEVRVHSTITNDLHALEKALRRIRGAHPAATLEACYEAGPCGFGIARRLGQLGVPCAVIAPSLIPKRSGDRVKTDKRDAVKLARLLRAGELTAVYVPEPADEAIRDLCRARTDAVDDIKRSKQRLKSFLLRAGYRYQGKAIWGPAHLRYLRELVLAHPAQKIILEDYLVAIAAARERSERCEENMLLLLEGWRLKPAVEALMACKGFQLVAAMITVSELGDIHRFAHPRQLMAYLGLVSSEHSSGPKQRQGAVSRCGNGHLRWLLIDHPRLGSRGGACHRQPEGRDERERASQCSQHYANPPKVSQELSKPQEGQSREVRAISWKAQNRLHLRLIKLAARRLHRNSRAERDRFAAGGPEGQPRRRLSTRW